MYQSPWSFGFDSQTRGTRENRSPPCVKVQGSSRVPTSLHSPRFVVFLAHICARCVCVNPSLSCVWVCVCAHTQHAQGSYAPAAITHTRVARKLMTSLYAPHLWVSPAAHPDDSNRSTCAVEIDVCSRKVARHCMEGSPVNQGTFRVCTYARGVWTLVRERHVAPKSIYMSSFLVMTEVQVLQSVMCVSVVYWYSI